MEELISLRIPRELTNEVEKVSKKLQRSKSFIIRKAIETFINEYIDYFIAVERLKDKDDEIVAIDELKK